MIRLNRRGVVPLLVLMIAMTLFAGLATGIAKLLRSREERYPYQVQTYQAYALAHAGIEFAKRYGSDNGGPSNPNFSQYIPTGTPKDFVFGNGKFSLRYVAAGGSGTCPVGCDTLYSRGTYGTAVREVALSAPFTSSCKSLDPGNSLIQRSDPTIYHNPADPVFGTGDRIQLFFCDPSQVGTGWSWIVTNNLTIAATQPVNVTRVAVMQMMGYPWGAGYSAIKWVWDAACITDGSNCSAGRFQGKAISGWDGVSNPPNGVTFNNAWNQPNSWDPINYPGGGGTGTGDSYCRPQICPNDATLSCMTYGWPITRSRTWNCNQGSQNFGSTLNFGVWPGGGMPTIIIETAGYITLPTKFFVSFKHIPAQPGVMSPNLANAVLNKFTFTVSSSSTVLSSPGWSGVPQ